MMIQNRAQGTIEYLVILAIVVVISLVVVGLFTGMFSNSSQQIRNSSSKLNNVSGGGISIVESVLDSQGDALVKLGNYSNDSIILKRVTVGGVPNDFSEQVVATDSKTFSLSDLSSGCACTANQKSVSCEYIINYTQNGIEKTERLTKTIDCVSDATPTSTQMVVGLGSGTLADPWIINSCQELQDMNLYMDGNYALGADINCAETRNWNNGAGFDPIGNCASGNACSSGSHVYDFNGNFNGRNFKILNLYIYRPTSTDVGLFEVISPSSTISNLGIVDNNITGQMLVGSLAGENYGIVRNNYSTGRVRGGNYVGGLLGYNERGIVSQNYTTGVTIGTIDYTGGLIGYDTRGIINNNYTTGATTGYIRTGGLLGLASRSTIQNSYNIGQVIGTYWYAGGLVGYLMNSFIINSYNQGDVNLMSGSVDSFGPGGISGLVYDSNITNCYNLGNVYTIKNAAGGITSAVFKEINPSIITNSFSIGKVFGPTGDVNGLLDIAPVGSLTTTNLWWYDQAGDTATTCGTTCSTSTTDTNFYDSTQAVYVGTPVWADGNWVWTGSALPTLSWE